MRLSNNIPWNPIFLFFSIFENYFSFSLLFRFLDFNMVKSYLILLAIWKKIDQIQKPSARKKLAPKM